MNMRIRKLGAHDITGIIRSDIAKGKLADSTRLPPERSLANNYNVARGTIRKAIQQLETEGLVKIKAGSGVYVHNPKSDDPSFLLSEYIRPLEVIDARFAFEPHICRLAVLNASQKDLAEAERLLAVMELQTKNVREFVSTDAALRNFLAQLTGNSLLVWMVTQINSTQRQEQWIQLFSMTLTCQSMDEHIRQYREIITAIRNRTPDKAADLMKNHLENLRLLVTRAVAV